MVGTSFPYSTHLPEHGKVRVVQIDADPSLVGMRLPTEAPVVADDAILTCDSGTIATWAAGTGPSAAGRPAGR